MSLIESLARRVPHDAARRVVEFLDSEQSGQVILDVNSGRVVGVRRSDNYRCRENAGCDLPTDKK